MQGPVQQGESLVDEDVDRVLRLADLVQPAGRLALVGEGGEGADRGRPAEGQRRRLVGGFDPPRPALAPAGGGADLLQDQDALRTLGPSGARQVATVGQRQRPGEIELDESE